MWGRRIDFNDRNDNSIQNNHSKVNKVSKTEGLDTDFAYSNNAFKNRISGFTGYFDSIFRRLKKTKKYAVDRELNQELLSNDIENTESIKLEKENLNPKQKAIKKTWFYMNIFGLIFFIIVVTIAIIYTYGNYEDAQQAKLGILGM